MDHPRAASFLVGAVGASIVAVVGCGGGDPLQDPAPNVDASIAVPPAIAATDADSTSSPPDATAHRESIANAAVDAPIVSSCGTSAALPAGVTTSANGARVTCGAHAIALSLVRDGIVRLTYDHDPASIHSYAVLAGAPSLSPSFGSDPGALYMCSSLVTVRVDTSACRVKVTAADGTVLLDDGATGGLFTASEIPSPGPLGPVLSAAPVTGLERALDPDAHIYGLGATTGTEIDRRGHRVELWNTDAYDPASKGFAPNAPLLYTSLPLFLETVRGTSFGVFTDDPGRLRFDFDLESQGIYRVNAFSATLDQYAIVGPTNAEVYARYADLTGHPMAPPNWALGFQMSRWENPCDGTPGRVFCSFDEVKSVAATLRAKRIPADGIWLDIQHMDGYRSFTWDSSRFSDPGNAIADLSEQGFRTNIIVDPGIKVDDAWAVYSEGLQNSYYLMDPVTQKPYIGEVWPGDAVFPDFTLPAARTWWSGLAASQVALGVRGIWNDMNEPSNQVSPYSVPNTVPVAGDGTPATMAEMHDAYALNEAEATYDGMQKAAPNDRPFILSRGAYAGQQRYTALWTGDAPSTWATLQMTPAMLINLSLAGMPIIGSDVGGYSGQGDAGAELYARWFALGSVSPFFRVHAASDAERQEPWAFGDATEEAARQLASARYALLPYWESLVLAATTTGEPILRPLSYEFPNDGGSVDRSDEWMIGPSLLVAPILTPSATSRSIYLPPGTWYEAQSGAIYPGGTTITVATTDVLPIEALPIFVREGGIVPHTAPLQWTDQAPVDHLTLDLYPSDPSTSFTYLESDGTSPGYQRGEISAVTYTTQRTSAGATVHAGERSGGFTRPVRPLWLRVRRVDQKVSGVRWNGAPLTASSTLPGLAPPGYFVDQEDRAIVVALPDDNAFDLTLGYDPAVTEPAPLVDVPFAVTLPPNTQGATIAIASSTIGWGETPLVVGADHVARGTLAVARGDWFTFKFTRGDWSSVEVSSDCSPRANRGAIASASEVAATVHGWIDACP